MNLKCPKCGGEEVTIYLGYGINPEDLEDWKEEKLGFVEITCIHCGNQDFEGWRSKAERQLKKIHDERERIHNMSEGLYETADEEGVKVGKVGFKIAIVEWRKRIYWGYPYEETNVWHFQEINGLGHFRATKDRGFWDNYEYDHEPVFGVEIEDKDRELYKMLH